MSIFAARLKEVRTTAGLSQERLGVLAGIDEASASARMNQYEGEVDVDSFLFLINTTSRGEIQVVHNILLILLKFLSKSLAFIELYLFLAL